MWGRLGALVEFGAKSAKLVVGGLDRSGIGQVGELVVDIDQPCGGLIRGVLVPAASEEQIVALVTVAQAAQPAGQAGALCGEGLETGLFSCMRAVRSSWSSVRSRCRWTSPRVRKASSRRMSAPSVSVWSASGVTVLAAKDRLPLATKVERRFTRTATMCGAGTESLHVELWRRREAKRQRWWVRC